MSVSYYFYVTVIIRRQQTPAGEREAAWEWNREDDGHRSSSSV